MGANGPVEVEEKVVYISGREAARRLGVSSISVSRAARREHIGIVVEGGRVAAIAVPDLPRLRASIRSTSGNPDWIDSGRGAKKRRPRRKTA
jgi:hypothetical protein